MFEIDFDKLNINIFNRYYFFQKKILYQEY